MGIIKWGPELETGIASVDREHRQLVDTLNELLTAMSGGKGGEVCTTIVGRLNTYAAQHFTAEEKLFADSGYPDTARHADEHRKFTDKAAAFQADCAAGRKFLTMPVAKFLSDWLVNHIQGQDMQYVSYLKAKGAR
ncbi:hemerythrin-like metal-binding protein [Desulfovibrio sp. X2]|uniref:bacteriohemerythrin n=1 Tax=Desulfovibrio sp. X2 TaxID=941449 RepID=UPI0003588136|nr:bacteriohemerythrin [Desulfovibrio sp. X2]EPR42671.1 hemerythrin-like metal-binding protein [Desulfovibrio sp. X2]